MSTRHVQCQDPQRRLVAFPTFPPRRAQRDREVQHRTESTTCADDRLELPPRTHSAVGLRTRGRLHGPDDAQSSRARLRSDAALLLLQGIWLSVRHEGSCAHSAGPDECSDQVPVRSIAPVARGRPRRVVSRGPHERASVVLTSTWVAAGLRCDRSGVGVGQPPPVSTGPSRCNAQERRVVLRGPVPNGIACAKHGHVVAASVWMSSRGTPS